MDLTTFNFMSVFNAQRRARIRAVASALRPARSIAIPRGLLLRAVLFASLLILSPTLVIAAPETEIIRDRDADGMSDEVDSAVVTNPRPTVTVVTEFRDGFYLQVSYKATGLAPNSPITKVLLSEGGSAFYDISFGKEYTTDATGAFAWSLAMGDRNGPYVCIEGTVLVVAIADSAGNIATGIGFTSCPTPHYADLDGDGLSDADEARYGTDRINRDTDSDGIIDGEEVHFYGTDPLTPDLDGNEGRQCGKVGVCDWL